MAKYLIDDKKTSPMPTSKAQARRQLEALRIGESITFYGLAAYGVAKLWVHRLSNYTYCRQGDTTTVTRHAGLVSSVVIS
ncbi:MAG: hypothetical protein ABSC48_02915 [Terracidiphilus sp.]|jgi:hypothetical protein